MSRRMRPVHARRYVPGCRFAQATEPVRELSVRNFFRGQGSRPETRQRRPILMRGLMLRLCADLGFRAHHLAKAMRVASIEPLVVALHALVAGGHHLPRVLLP